MARPQGMETQTGLDNIRCGAAAQFSLWLHFVCRSCCSVHVQKGGADRIRSVRGRSRIVPSCVPLSQSCQTIGIPRNHTSHLTSLRSNPRHACPQPCCRHIAMSVCSTLLRTFTSTTTSSNLPPLPSSPLRHLAAFSHRL